MFTLTDSKQNISVLIHASLSYTLGGTTILQRQYNKYLVSIIKLLSTSTSTREAMRICSYQRFNVSRDRPGIAVFHYNKKKKHFQIQTLTYH